MGIFTRLNIADIKKDIRSDIYDIALIERKEDDIREGVESLLNSGSDLKSIAEEILKDDLELLKLLKGRADKKNFEHAVEIMKFIQSLLDRYVVMRDEKDIEHICTAVNDVLELIHITEELERKEETRLLKEFDELLLSKSLKDEDIEDFLGRHSNFFKAKPHKKLEKKMSKLLKSRLVELDALSPGPVVIDKEVTMAAKRIHQFFSSPQFKELVTHFVLGRIRVNISIYGSLVSGFASNESKHRGRPTDEGRVSDVDIGIVLEDDIISKMRFSGGLFRSSYFGPFKEGEAAKAGPFAGLFNYLKDLHFAGRQDRSIGVIIASESFYRSHLKENRHIVLFDDVVQL